MNLCALAVFVPLLAAPVLGFSGTPGQGALANAALTGLVFLLTIGAFFAAGSGLIHADQLGLVFGAVTGFVGFSTALAGIAYVRGAAGRLSLRRWRVYHAMCQVVLGATLLGLYADNIGVLWAAMEGTTIAATLGVSLPRSASALEAAWKYFILGGVGIGLALFGTMLVYLAAQPALGPGLQAMSFAALAAHAAGMDGSLLTLAFVFILFGYGTKAALVPLHGWLPDAYAEGPAPLTTALSGLTLNVALIAILRYRHLMQVNVASGGAAMQPGAVFARAGSGLDLSHRLLALPAARCAALLRLLLHRAFRHRRFRLRHWRAGRHLRRAAAYDAADAGEIGLVPGAHPRRRPARLHGPGAIWLLASARAAELQRLCRMAAGGLHLRPHRHAAFGAVRLGIHHRQPDHPARPLCLPAAGAGAAALRRGDPAQYRAAGVRPGAAFGQTGQGRGGAASGGGASGAGVRARLRHAAGAAASALQRRRGAAMIILSPADWAAHQGKFIALWSDATYAYALYQPGALVAVALENGGYPALPHAGAGWFQRLDHDFTGHIAIGAADTRPAVEHFRTPDGSAPWPEFPLAPGEGVHQVAVGPIHAGIIEPGHFRFSVRGEEVLKLEARLGYAHKGTLGAVVGMVTVPRRGIDAELEPRLVAGVGRLPAPRRPCRSCRANSSRNVR